MLTAVRQLFAISVLQILTAMGTGILSARALGVVGRGNLASVTAPLSLAPYALGLGMTTYATRAAARGVDSRRLLGTLGGASIVVGVAAIPLGLWLASVLAAGRHDVEGLIAVGVVLLPLGLFGGILTSIAMGLQEWRLVTRQRLIAVTLPLLAYVVLDVIGELTVVSAALAIFASGTLSLAPMTGILRRSWPPTADRQIGTEAIRYGAKITPLMLSQLMNLTLDQVIMAPLVSPRQLGLYTVAVTVASLTATVSASVSTVMFPRLAQDVTASDPAQLVRVGMLTVLLLGILLAVISPVALPLLFGSAFAKAYPLVLVLLVASIPLAGVGLFSVVYTARNKLGTAGWSEIVALVMTVVGLLLLLHPLGAMGAAIVSLIAYSTNFLWLLAMAPRNFGGRRRDYVLLHRQDLHELRDQANRARRSLPWANSTNSSA